MSAPGTPPVSPAKRAVQGVLGLLFLGLAFQAYDRVKLRMSGAPRAALERLQACEAARELLGEPIDAAWWGWSSGYIKVPRQSQVWSAASGRVKWSMPVAGASGRGVFRFEGEKVNGFWTLDGVLEVGGTTVFTRGCAAAQAAGAAQ